MTERLKQISGGSMLVKMIRKSSDCLFHRKSKHKEQANQVGVNMLWTRQDWFSDKNMNANNNNKLSLFEWQTHERYSDNNYSS